MRILILFYGLPYALFCWFVASANEEGARHATYVNTHRGHE